ncbi:hypothetical protein JKF63_02372 [Porcisia hertigi]|uniref:Uncharacterized protein n=1 Tax=Porcisia hertigi TaxID=2761500 RepID=A0A836HR31_9TRYP|nr:hypothetical protein JKF63_02372 [Porcisia hertigi]
MSVDGRRSRASMSRSGAAPQSTRVAIPFFSELPVPLPNLDALRITDVFARAYYASLHTTLPTAPPAGETASSGVDAVPLKAYVPSAEIASAADEHRTTGEVFCAAVARELVESAANLFASRSLDRLVDAYTACAAWDDMRDVVATSFSPQDYGDITVEHRPHSLSVSVAAPCPTNSDGTVATTTTAPTPYFLRSALSLAGVFTRKPSCALAPQTSIISRPLSAGHNVAIEVAHLECPVPPVPVPVDAYCRYVMKVEDALVSPSALSAAQSLHRRGLGRPSGTTRTTKSGDKSASKSSAAPPLLPSPPPQSLLRSGQRGRRVKNKAIGDASHDAALLASRAESRGGHSPVAGSPEPLSDALTTAMQQESPLSFGDFSESVPHPDRSVARVTVTGDVVAQTGGNEPERKHIAKGLSRNSGVVLAVEEDRLWSTGRPRIGLPWTASRKNVVICSVTPPISDADAAVNEEEITPVVEAAAKETTEAPRRRNRGADWKKSSAPDAQSKKEAARAREAWASSFYTTADASEEIPLQNQVQVNPSAGVVVVETNASASPSSTWRSANKAAASSAVVASGGEFIVPTDRMALSSFSDKRATAHRNNGSPSRTKQLNRDNVRTAQVVKAAPALAPRSQH